MQSPTMRLYLSPLPACAAVSYQSETKGVIMLMPVYVYSLLAGDRCP